VAFDIDPNDIEADIRNAMKGEDAASATPGEASEAAGSETPPADAEPAADGPARGPDGKFVAKEPEAAQQSTQSTEPPPAAAEPEEAIRVPGSWKAELKARFSELPVEFQQEIARREQEMAHGWSEQHSRLNRLNQFEELLKPHKEKWALAGVDEVRGIQQLLAAQNFLERDPAGGLRYLAQQYGVQLPQLAQPAGQQPQEAQLNPALQPILQELSTLKQQIAAREQAEKQQQNQAISSQIETFRQNPAHLYFENVQEDMAVILQGGRAKDLAEA
jgi:hypothetical protein